ncbi:alpha-L-fucosidase [Dactylosporangium sp. AC04546]|uniref:alpha-L-fucosidase n=1 Tax=Dactylosporangium sp. AC04546 TaxID=2862460 RepID=UPI001EDDB698|nr:alpha-L-fucosidase [Dactylosporangium sp. AC04546]WVK80556.1 alpha-L-fucosidase [Dactylosporangium sp. AC04546]
MSPFLSRRQLLAAGALTGAALVTGSAISGQSAAAYTVPARMAWWYAARFGMFIHFGSYSYLGRGEWAFNNEHWTKYDYQTQVSANFNPTSFSASTIVGLAKSAGMKYLVITAKHHEGFAMWDSQVAGFTDTTGTTRYTLPSYSGYQPDLLAALKAECDAQGIKFGLYYSILDWNHPSQTIRRTDVVFSTMSSPAARIAYIEDMKAHLQELLTRYDPAILWFDGDWCANAAAPTADDWWTEADGQDLYNWLLARKPVLIVNERVKRGLGLGDFECPEETVPPTALPRPWETNCTMNGSWGYNAGSENWYRSSTALIQEMVTVVSRDGNYLLNIGPTGSGSVTPGSVAALQDIGAWMSTYGDSIYGTTASPYTFEPWWGRFTKKAGKLYAHVFQWPADGALRLPAVQNAITRVYLLNAPGTSLSYTISGDYINVTVPTQAPNAHASVVVVEVTGTPTPTATPAIVSGGTYKLVCQRSGKALDNGNTHDDGTWSLQWTDHGGPQQRWTITATGSGRYKLVNHLSGKALDNGNTIGEGAPVMQWTDNGGPQQRWTITSVSSNRYKLVCQRSGKALDNGNTADEGATAIQWTDNGGSPQTWQLTRVG